MILNKKLLVTSIALLGALLSFNAMGQDTNESLNTLTLGLSEVSLIKTSTNAVSLVLTPQSAGQAVKPSISDSTVRVLVSSVITVATRTMSVAFSGTLPTGTYLTLQAKVPNANFVGGQGIIGALATYSGTGSQNIISGIGTCYTGTAAGDGYVLKYTFGISAEGQDYGTIRATGGETVTATFTLTAAV